MAFERYTWTDRNVQYPGRRRILNVDDNTDAHTVDVQRNSDSPSQTGDRFNASTMNDLESRIASAFASIDSALAAQFNAIYPVGCIYTSMDNKSPQTIFNNGSVWVQITNGIPLMLGTSPGTVSGNNSKTFTPTGNINLSGSVADAYADLPAHTHQWSDHESAAVTSAYNRPKGTGGDTNPWTHRSGLTSTNTSKTSSEVGGLSTSKTGECKAHNHPFGPIYGTFTGKSVTVDTRQPQNTIYAWRRTS